jgi:acyl-CoA thioester hydrolase
VATPLPAADTAVPTRAQFAFWTREKLRNADTDQFGHVNNAAIATFLEAGRMELFAVPALASIMAGANIVVGRLSTTFHAELFFPGEVEIGSTVTRVGRTSFDVLQGVFQGATCIASAQAACVMLRERSPFPIPAAVRAHLLRSAAAG